MELSSLQASIEAILFAAGEPVPIKKISLCLGVDDEIVRSEIDGLKKILVENNHGIVILSLSDKIQMCTLPKYSDLINSVLEQRKPTPLTKAALEVLAIVAYYQPVTRAYIDRLRGVDSTFTVNHLLDKDLIRESGHLDSPGRPALFATTDNFLKIMGIENCGQLPELPK